MKFIVYIAILFFCFSCKTAITAQQKNNDSIIGENVKNAKPTFSEKDINNKNNPNTIKLVGEIMSLENNITLCGVAYENIIIIKVKKIISLGFGIVNMLNKEKNFKAILPVKLLFHNEKSPNLIFKKGDLFEINVLEKLCPDTSKTTYFIASYDKI